MEGIILGVGAPNTTSSGSKTKCAIILTESMGFVRVYPILANIPFPVWTRVKFDAAWNEKDGRKESYKIQPGFELGTEIDDRDERAAILDDCCLKSGVIDPIQYQNDRCASIALVVVPFEGRGTRMDAKIPEVQEDDPEFSWLLTQQGHWAKPYLAWRSQQGSNHCNHLAGHEIYEGMRKHPENPNQVFSNMQILNPDYRHWLLLGNMKDRRNVWVIVHDHRQKKTSRDSMLLSLPMAGGRKDGWPYLAQEPSNVSVAGNQLALFTTEPTRETACRGNTLMRT